MCFYYYFFVFPFLFTVLSLSCRKILLLLVHSWWLSTNKTSHKWMLWYQILLFVLFSIFGSIYMNECHQYLIKVFQALWFVGWMKWKWCDLENEIPISSPFCIILCAGFPLLNQMRGTGCCLVTANPSRCFSNYKLQYHFFKILVNFHCLETTKI